MKVKKDFVAKFAIGIKGVALMEITEVLSPDSSYLDSDTVPNLILGAIDQYGLENWVNYYLNDVPTEPGICTFIGTAEFSEDNVTFI